MNRRKAMMTVAAMALVLGFGLSAGDTRRWEYSRFEQWSAGKLEGLELSSTGEIKPSWSVETKAVEANGIWSMALGRSGEVYLGTGNRGKLLVYQRGEVKELYDTGKVAVTRVRMDRNGNLWFSAMPGGTIYRRTPGGEVQKVVETGENYVWDFLLAPSGIIAATGPNGKIVKYSESGALKGVVETGEVNVMTLLLAGDGRLYAGTADEGLVLEIPDTGRPRVVRDFDEKEVRSLLWVGEGRNGTLVAAVNYQAGARPSEAPPLRPAAGEQAGENEGKEGKPGEEKKESVVISETRPAPQGGGRVSGAVYALSASGGARRILDLSGRAAVDSALVGNDIYVATDREGKVYRCRLETGEYALALDLPQAQILSLLAEPKGLLYLGAGSPAALLAVKKARAEKISFTTQVLDATLPARWGGVDWLADGGPLRILSRSGNLSDPGRGWSEWETAAPGKPASLKSPQARYLQVRVEWPAGSEAELKYLSIPYRTLNQPHTVDLVVVDGPDKDSGGGKPVGSDPSGTPPHQTKRRIAWKVSNLDDDPLLSTIFFQPDGVTQWIPFPLPEPLTSTTYSWDTISFPDGWYRIKVVVTDAPANPPDEVFTAAGVSDRVLVDNTAPEFKGLTAAGRVVAGKVEDAFSALAGLQYSLDGGAWIKILPEDGVLDSPQEDFKITLPESVAAGPHVILFRAWDRSFNLGTGQVVLRK